jgi:NTE family protein
VLCLAVDLLPLSAMLPKTVGEAASRLQDLVFAAQSRRSIERWRDHHDGRKDLSVVLVRTAYQEDVAEVAGKAMDFSGQTIGQRWSDGYAAGEVFAKAVEQGLPELGVAGLSVIEL